MMVPLTVALIQSGTASGNLAGTVVTVRQVGGVDGAFPDEPFEDATVFSGSAPIYSFDVPLGIYKVEARLPGGSTLHQKCTINVEQPYDVRLVLEAPAHDWLEWQTGTGNVAPKKAYHRQTEDIFRRSLRAKRYDFLPSTGSKHLALRSSISPIWALRTAADSEGSGMDYRRPAWWRGRSPTIMRASASFVSLTGATGIEVSLEQSSDEFTALWTMNSFEGSEEHFRAEPNSAADRPIALITVDGARYCAFLPDAWRLDNGQLARIELLYDSIRRPGRGLRISVVDEERSGLLSYLGAGRMAEATLAFDASDMGARILEEMKTKRRNPLAAAAAAYIGLSIPVGDRRREQWSPWLKNLMRWFPDLPDGAILYARDRLDRATSAADLSRALKALVVAYRRGPPQFSVGVRHLLDGLGIFMGSAPRYGVSGEALARMHKEVARFALLTDPDQVFTVVAVPPELA